ncbi:MAG: hypothetical protein JSW58_00365 [Candidatus Latescibacterota bacterium]|nr:MAG: hypothetical protein JSW58_00365 [Candidatus Latescibacterota bacterium]
MNKRIERTIRILLLALVPMGFYRLPTNLSAQSFLPVYQNGSGEFEIDYVIGGDIDDEEYFFFSPRDVGLDSQENLFVLDYKGYCIKKFDPEGAHLKTFGRQGEGPGEMMGPVKMAIDPDDNVVIYDFRNNRFTIFDSDGNFLNGADVNEIGWRPVVDIHFDPNGFLYLRSWKEDYSQRDPETLTLVSRLKLDAMEETGVDSTYIRQWYKKHAEQGVTSVSSPFYPELLFNVTPTGNVVVAHSGTYTIKVYDSDLKVLHETQFEGKRQTVTEEDKSDYFSRFEGAELKTWMRGIVDFPKYKPYFETLIIDHEGYLLFLVENDEDETHVFDVFTPDCEFINRVELPRVHSTAIFKNGLIYTIKRSEDEEPTVCRYSLK